MDNFENATSWLHPNGTFHPIKKYGSHSNWAYHNNKKLEELFASGWMRVTFIGDTIYISNDLSVLPTFKQKKSIIDLSIESDERFKKAIYENGKGKETTLFSSYDFSESNNYINFKNWLILSEEQLLNERWRDIGGGIFNFGNEVFKIRFDQEHTFIAYVPITNKTLGRLIVGYKNEDGSRSVFDVTVDPVFRRQGIATSLYKAAEQEFGKLTPSTAQSDNAFDFWKTYRPEAVKNKTDLRPFKDQLIGKKFDHPRLGPMEIIEVNIHTATGLIKNRERHTEIFLNKNDLIKFNLLP